MTHSTYIYSNFIALLLLPSLLMSMDHKTKPLRTYNKLSNIGHSALAQAAARGDLEKLRNLLKDVVSVDTCETGKWTPLQGAIFCKQPESVKLLCKKNAEIFRRNFGMTAMDIAIMREDNSMIALLKELSQ